ncbi:hypothetical protein F4782DRAFT_112919 [Xylaria castorea]|nr:hypothetical protein F4782DRAFT_112919 [Xylaria castorea]
MSKPLLTTTSSKEPPSCQTVAASGAVCTLCNGSTDLVYNTIKPPAPTQTSSNNKGPSLCESEVSGDDCTHTSDVANETWYNSEANKQAYSNEKEPLRVN